MTTDTSTLPTGIPRSHRNLLLTSSVMTFLLITMGAIVSTTASGLGCPDWPTCYGQIVPPAQIAGIIEYTHRFIAALTTPVILLTAFLCWRNLRAVPLVRRLPVISIPFLFTVITLGALTVLRGIPPLLAVIDVGSALIVLALLLTATTVAFARSAGNSVPDRLVFKSPFAKLALWTALGVYVVLVSSVLVLDKTSVVRGLSFPLYGEGIDLAQPLGALRGVRHLLGAVTSVMVVAVVVQAWRTEQAHVATIRAAMILGTLFIVETIVGLLMAMAGVTVLLLIVYVAAGAGLWAAIVVVAVLAGVQSPVNADNLQGSTASLPHRV